MAKKVLKRDGGKKKSAKQPPPKMLNEVKITAKAPKKYVPQSDTHFGLVPTRKIDSMKKANPELGRVIGKPYKGSGGMDTYGTDQSDAIKAGLRKKK